MDLQFFGGNGKSNLVNGNSKSSTKTQNGYEISEKQTGDVVKTGISGQTLNKNQASPRANQQVNKLNNEAGYVKYEAKVVKQNIPNRIDALDWERQHSQKVHEKNGLNNRLKKHIIK